jgi:hypothetical protein
MPAKSRFNSQFASRWSQILVQNCLSPIRLLSIALPASKNPVFWLAIRRLFIPPDERFADAGMDLEQASVMIRFCTVPRNRGRWSAPRSLFLPRS